MLVPRAVTKLSEDLQHLPVKRIEEGIKRDALLSAHQQWG